MSTRQIKALIQARLGSTRLPGKVLLPIVGMMTLLETVISRVLKSKYVSKEDIVVLTTDSVKDDDLVSFLNEKKFKYFRGSENDVYQRFYDYLIGSDCDAFIRVCSDNPFIEPSFIDKQIEMAESLNKWDYISYREGDTPAILTHYGLFVELVNKQSFLDSKTLVEQKDTSFKEHVTPIFYKDSRYRPDYIDMDKELDRYPYMRTTVDTEADYMVIKKILEYFKDQEIEFSYKDLLTYLSSNIDVQKIMINEKNNNRKK